MLVDTQMTTSNFKLSNTTLLTDDDSEDSQDCAQDDNGVAKDSSDFTREFKEYIPGEPDSDDDAQGLVPYLDSDNESNISASTNSSLQPEEVSRHKDPVSESEFRNMQGKTFAPATNKKIGWAVKIYCDWRSGRIQRGLGGEQIEKSDILDPGVDVDHLKNSICLFLSEIRCVDGGEYPGPSLYNIVVMLQLHFECQGKTWKLLDDPTFRCIRNMLDNLMKRRSLDRVTKPVKAVEPITLEDEETLWGMHILGEESPDQLRDTVLFLVGLTFALRGGKEHRALRAPGFEPQIVMKKNEKGVCYLEYREDFHSKTNQGGIGDRKHQPKVVRAYSHSNQDCNIVH